jgi:hypothetical protein
MPSKSKSQQRLFGWVHACQSGRGRNCDKVADIASSIKPKDAEDFARTKHKGLPSRVRKKKKAKSFKEFVTEKDTNMKSFKMWQEDVAAVAPTEVPAGSAWDNVHVGPQNRLNSRVRVGNDKFDKFAGDAAGGMSINQKVHFILDQIQSITGDSPDAQELRKDHQLLQKLRTSIIKLDSVLKNYGKANG